MDDREQLGSRTRTKHYRAGERCFSDNEAWPCEAERLRFMARKTEAFLDGIYLFALDSGEHLTCSELDSLIDLYRSAGRDYQADGLLDPKYSSHVRKDEEGDSHYVAEV